MKVNLKEKKQGSFF